MCSWKTRDARLPHVACLLFSTRRIAIGSSCGSSACQNATLMPWSPRTRVCLLLLFFTEAALEMMILMHFRGAVPANVSKRMPWAISIATNLLRTSGPSGPCFTSFNQWHLTFLSRARGINTRSDSWCLTHANALRGLTCERLRLPKRARVDDSRRRAEAGRTTSRRRLLDPLLSCRQRVCHPPSVSLALPRPRG